jgi:hypothetical protein
MSKRLQVLLDEREYGEIQKIARRHRVTVSEWVRNALRYMCRRESLRPADRKLEAVRAAVRHEFPTADMEQMLAEIDRGYLHDAPR